MCLRKWFDRESGGNVYATPQPPPLHLFTSPQAGRISKPIFFILVWIWISILNFIYRSLSCKVMMRWQKYGKEKTSQRKISKMPAMSIRPTEKRLIKMILTTILFIQTQIGFYDSCLEHLLRFIKLIIQLIKSNYSIESIQKLFEIFPSSIYMARQSIYLERDSFKKYVISTVSHSLTTYEDTCTKSLTTKKITMYSR